MEISKEIKTQKLTIPLKSKNGFKIFYITEEQANTLAKAINSNERFIVLSPETTGKGVEFYPKDYVTLETIDKDDLENLHKKSYAKRQNEEIQKKEQENKIKKQKKISDFMYKNPKEYDFLINTKIKNLKESLPFSSKITEHKIKLLATGIVHDLILKDAL